MSFAESLTSSSSFYQTRPDRKNLSGGTYQIDSSGGFTGLGQQDYGARAERRNNDVFRTDSADTTDDQYSSTEYIDSGAATKASSSGLKNGEEKSSSLEKQSSSSTDLVYSTSDQGLYQDPNPEIVRRPAREGIQTYTQRVSVRFLQPPPIPPPGPLIVKEVRPPQPPPPPPLYIRQVPPPPPTLPPIVIREAPPKLPPPVGTQVITKMLPALPAPPRSVIIERLPPLPPKPRDVIVERWLPYRTEQKRRVIIQRAPPPVIQKPRNIIIYYEAPKAQVVRRFENLGVQQVDPSEYVARYGTQLEDTQSLIAQARKAGVVEDLSPPVSALANLQSSSSYEINQSTSVDTAVGTGNYNDLSFSTSGYNLNGDLSQVGGTTLNWNSGFDEMKSNSYELSSSYNASSGNTDYLAGYQSYSGALDMTDNTNNAIDGMSTYTSYTSNQIRTQ